MTKKRKKSSAAGKAGVAAGLAARSFSYAKRVDWPAVWLRAQWLSHHTRRLYNNLTEAERKEFMDLVIPTKGKPIVARQDRGRVQDLVAKAFTGNSPG